ncbi:MAG: DUF6179 domain-containing protein, partial [Alicyclobacillus shizuokensis]|nr:DUF6179 domain-containing protein [Alicyclobacillus shizuokensis]
MPGDAGYAASDNQSLTSSNDINPSRLNKHQYTLSLLNEAQRIGLLSHQEVYSIQYKLMVILQDLIRRYTQGESSSVATDTAESILTSILYAVDADLLNFEHPNQAITYLKTSDVVKLYERGVERVSQCLEEVKSLYKEVKQHKLDVPVAAYNTTIDESLPLFIKKYNILFEAHNTMASIDYPLAMDNMRLQGVFYMKHYLERLQLENEFCSRFNPKALIHIM